MPEQIENQTKPTKQTKKSNNTNLFPENPNIEFGFIKPFANNSEINENPAYLIPLGKCSSCFGDVFPTKISFVCEDCGTAYQVDASEFYESLLKQVDNIKIKSILLDDKFKVNNFDSTMDENYYFKVGDDYIYPLRIDKETKTKLLILFNKLQKRYYLPNLFSAIRILFTAAIEWFIALESGTLNRQPYPKKISYFKKAYNEVANKVSDINNTYKFLKEISKEIATQNISEIFGKIDNDFRDKWKEDLEILDKNSSAETNEENQN